MQLSAAALWINTVFATFDLSVTEYIHQLYIAAGSFFTPFFNFISFLGKDGIILILLSIGLTLFKKTRKCGTAMLIALTIGAILTNCCLKILIARPRPYADTESAFYRLWLLVGQNTESDKSFPSGHTTAAFAAMTGLFFTTNRKYSWTGFIFAVLMGVARIYLVVHFPSDVLAGVIVGILSGVAAYIITLKLPDTWFTLTIIRTKNDLSVDAKQ